MPTCMNFFHRIADKQRLMMVRRLRTVSLFLENRVEERKTSKRASLTADRGTSGLWVRDCPPEFHPATNRWPRSLWTASLKWPSSEARTTRSQSWDTLESKRETARSLLPLSPTTFLWLDFFQAISHWLRSWQALSRDLNAPFLWRVIIVPRGYDPFGQHQESRPMAALNFWACAEYSFCKFQPIGFFRFE